MGGFGCPICSEKLDRLPAEAQSRAGGGGGGAGELNISATPCGHIFHSYCIQKWLSGSLASSKQCPCCRKDVPRLRCLALFPTTYDESILDDSLSQGGDGYPQVAPCNHGEVISSLKNQVNRLETEAKEKDQMYDLLSGDYSTLLDKFRTEKMTSDTWMMRAKQYESYRDMAEQAEARAKKAEGQLRTFSQIENLIKGVETSVNEELPSYPPTQETVRSLLEVKNVVSTELRHTNTKYNELKKNYEQIRTDKMKLKVQHEKIVAELKEMKHIYEISRINGRVRSASPAPGSSSAALGSTPKAFRTKRRFQEPSSTPSASATASSSASSSSTSAAASAAAGSVDSDVDIFPTSFKAKKAKPTTTTSKLTTSQKHATTSQSQKSSQGTSSGNPLLKKKAPKFSCGLSPIVPPTAEKDLTIDLCSSEEASFEEGEDEELRIRGNVPGAPLPIAASRVRNLQNKSSRPVLGTTKKFTFKKPATSQ